VYQLNWKYYLVKIHIKKGSILSKDLIVKDNRLIISKYHLTITQVKFISYLSTLIDKSDEDFTTYNFRVKDILEILEIERSNYKKLRIALRSLATKYVILQDTDKIIEETTFLSYFKLDKKNDIIQVRFDKSLKPFLLQLQTRFTKLSFKKILSFDSQYTIRFYEILEARTSIYNKYKNNYELEFEYKLDELKEMLLGDFNEKTERLEIPKSYHIYGNFKKKVLDVAKRELKEKGDYFFEYEPIKTGRKVTAIKFKIHKNIEKVKKDFRDKKRQFLLNGEEKQLVAEQIKRMIARQGDKIRDKLKYEQKMMQLYFQGKLKYDKDLQVIKDEMDKRALEVLMK
jgi:plasmid replication initiation protein